MPRSLRPRTASAAALALSCAAALLSVATAAPRAALAQVGVPSPVRYAPEGDRQIIFVNNPERLELGYKDQIPGSKDFDIVFNDLADPGLGGKTILDITVDAGNYRNFYEHVWNFNRSTTGNPAGANPIAYGVRVYNPNQGEITVTVRGRGFINNSNGGNPLAELLNSPNGPTGIRIVTLQPGEAAFVFRSDVDYAGTTRATVPSGNFFSGVVDFDITGGKAVVSNLAYQQFNDVFLRPALILPAPYGDFEDLRAPEYMGFITRRYANGTTPAPETRTYKGLMLYPNVNAATGFPLGGSVKAGGTVAAPLNFTVNDTVAANTALPVTYPRYVNDSSGTLNRFSPSTAAADQISRTFWLTHAVPIRDTANATNLTTGVYAVSSDMYDINQPGHGLLYSLFQTNTSNTIFGQFNVANWGVIYRHPVTVTNSGTRERTFALRMQNSGGTSPLAWRTANGPWQAATIGTASGQVSSVTYLEFTVGAGQTVTREGAFILGAPATGALRHTVTVTN